MKGAFVRTIYLLRHAKTENAEDGQSDAERALTERGVRDAAAMGAYLRALSPQPELVICSTATRTRQTLQHMRLHAPTELQSSLYLASAGELLSVLQQCDNAVQHVLLIGHNPGMHALVVMLMEDAANEADIEQLSMSYPTSTLACLSVELQSWAALTPASARLNRLHIARG